MNKTEVLVLLNGGYYTIGTVGNLRRVFEDSPIVRSHCGSLIFTSLEGKELVELLGNLDAVDKISIYCPVGLGSEKVGRSIEETLNALSPEWNGKFHFYVPNNEYFYLVDGIGTPADSQQVFNRDLADFVNRMELPGSKGHLQRAEVAVANP